MKIKYTKRTQHENDFSPVYVVLRNGGIVGAFPYYEEVIYFLAGIPVAGRSQYTVERVDDDPT